MKSIAIGILYKFVTKWQMQMSKVNDSLNVKTYSMIVTAWYRKNVADEMNIENIVII